jgi:hypothetical protein
MVRSKIAINDLILEIAVNLRYFGISSLNLRELLWRFRAGNFERCRQHGYILAIRHLGIEGERM